MFQFSYVYGENWVTCSLLKLKRWDSHLWLGLLNDLEKLLEVTYSVCCGQTAGEWAELGCEPSYLSDCRVFMVLLDPELCFKYPFPSLPVPRL